MQIHGTVAAGIGVAKLVPPELEVPRIVNRGVGRALTALEGRQCHKWLVGRARRVSAAQWSVQQGLVGRLVIALPNLWINAISKEIGIEGRFTDKGQNLSRSWIDCDEGAAPITKHVFDQLLQTQIN